MNLSEKYDQFCDDKNPSAEEKQMALRVGAALLKPEAIKQICDSALQGALETGGISPALLGIANSKKPESWQVTQDLVTNVYLERDVYPAWSAIHKMLNTEWPEKECERQTTLIKMRDWARKEEVKLNARELGIPFSVTPDMTDLECMWAPQVALLAHGAKIEQIEPQSALDVTGHTQIWSYIQERLPQYVQQAERLGKMMQTEMRSFNQPLNQEILHRAINFERLTYRQEEFRKPIGLLKACWKEGETLGKLLGDKNINVERNACRDPLRLSPDAAISWALSNISIPKCHDQGLGS